MSRWRIAKSHIKRKHSLEYCVSEINVILVDKIDEIEKIVKFKATNKAIIVYC